MQPNRTAAPPYNPVQGFRIWSPEPQDLPNGMKLFWFDGADQDLVRIEWIFDNQYREGIHSLLYSSLSSMLLEGTYNRTNAEIVDTIDFYGAYLVPEFNFDTTSLSLFCLNKHLDVLLPLVREILTEASFPERELQTFIRNSKQKLEITLQKNDIVAKRDFYHRLYGNTRYGQLSSPEQYDLLDGDQLRALYRLQIHPANCTVIVSGKVRPSTLDLIHKEFAGEWDHELANPVSADVQETYKLSSIDASLDFPSGPAGLYLTEKGESLQSALRLGCRSIQRDHPDFPALQLLNTILGGYFGSRLMRNIREEKGYTYGIGSGILSAKHTGFWTIATEVGVDVTRRTLQEIEKEIQILRTEKVDENELALVRNYMMGSLLGSLENVFSHADKFKSVYFSGLGLEYYDRYQKTIAEITSDRLLELANTYLDFGQLTQVVVGKLED